MSYESEDSSCRKRDAVSGPRVRYQQMPLLNRTFVCTFYRFRVPFRSRFPRRLSNVPDCDISNGPSCGVAKGPRHQSRQGKKRITINNVCKCITATRLHRKPAIRPSTCFAHAGSINLLMSGQSSNVIPSPSSHAILYLFVLTPSSCLCSPSRPPRLQYARRMNPIASAFRSLWFGKGQTRLTTANGFPVSAGMLLPGFVSRPGM